MRERAKEAAKITEFEKGVYADMSSADRCLLWMVKALEMKAFAEIMTEEDIALLKRAFDVMKGDEPK